MPVGSDPADTQMAMTMDMGSMGAGGAEMRLVDQVLLHERSVQLTEQGVAKIDLSDPNNPLGQSFGDLVGQLDPSKSVEDLEGAITSVETSDRLRPSTVCRHSRTSVVVDSTKIADASEVGGLGRCFLARRADLHVLGRRSDNLPRKLTSDMGESTIEATFTQVGRRRQHRGAPADEISKQDPFGAPAA
ncbi:MAG: hypothetical protein WKF83_16335 [Nocardioidaceae bacterium]